MIENGYYFGFPHREEAYPNSQEESHLVLEQCKNRHRILQFDG